MEVLKETVSNVYTRDLDFLLRRSTNENTPALVLDGQIQSRKGSYPGSVGLHPTASVTIPHLPGIRGWRLPSTITGDKDTNKSYFEKSVAAETIRDGYKWSRSENQWPE